MCKLLIVTGITEGLVAEEFIKRMAVPMSKTNRDGLGYTAVGPDGEMFSQRWLDNKHAFSTRNVMTPEIAKVLESYADRLPTGALDMNYSEMGDVNFANVKTITMHTRFATCGREFANTHPFIYEDTSLIHNGVIRNAFTTSYQKGLDVNKISTCDSESALQTYLAQGVNYDTTKAKAWIDLLSGGWAFGIISRNTMGNRILDVIRGTSMLYYMEVDGLGKVFTTDDDDAKGVIKDMGLTYLKDPMLVAMNEMYRYDAVSGEFLDSVDIKPVYKSHGGYNSSKNSRSTNTGTSNSSSNQSSQRGTGAEGTKKNGQALIDMVDAFRDDPDAMSLLPDIFEANSSIKDLRVDFRKVKTHCNDIKHPLLDRLDIFDLVFSSDYVARYESLPPSLKEYLRQMDAQGQGLKAVRGMINQLHEEKKKTHA